MLEPVDGAAPTKGRGVLDSTSVRHRAGGGERPRPSTASELPGILGTHQPEDQTEPLPLLEHLWIGVLGFLVELLRKQTNKQTERDPNRTSN